MTSDTTILSLLPEKVVGDIFSPILQSQQPAKLLPLLIYPDLRLNKVSKEVTDFNQDLLALIVDMHKTMLLNNGIGIAAPQVNVHKQLIVLQIEPNKPIVLINPKIIHVYECPEFTYNEGCLSVPGFFEDRERPSYVHIKFQKEDGSKIDHLFSGLYAFVVQHEIDHLNGKTFVDNSSPLKKDLIKSKIKKTLKYK